MTTKTSGAEFKRFYNDPAIWSGAGETYHEDECVLVNGGEHHGEYDTMADDAKVTIEGGIIFSPQFDGNEPSFEAYFKRWRKAQSATILIVEVDKKHELSVRAAIKTCGGRVLK